MNTRIDNILRQAFPTALLWLVMVFVLPFAALSSSVLAGSCTPAHASCCATVQCDHSTMDNAAATSCSVNPLSVVATNSGVLLNLSQPLPIALRTQVFPAKHVRALRHLHVEASPVFRDPLLLFQHLLI